MQRYFLSKGNKELNLSDQHHIINVMRMKKGDRVIICDNECYISEISIHKKKVSYKTIRKLKAIKKRTVTLIQGLINKKKLEQTVKYASMVGISKIVIVPMQKSKFKTTNLDKFIDRLKMISKEASELSQRDDLPIIVFKKNVKELILDHKSILFDLEGDRLELDQKLDNLTIIIGPESGLDQYEKEYFISKGAVKKSLGPLTLSSEVAGIIALSKVLNF
jgi:16S rRNA (uracil1498-N3)-methyltransferase